MNVNQLVFYHSVLQVFNVRLNKTPRYLNNMFDKTFVYNTRQADGEAIRMVGKPKLELSKDSFRWRASSQFNQLPPDIRNCASLGSFKIRVKSWTKENVSFALIINRIIHINWWNV